MLLSCKKKKKRILFISSTTYTDIYKPFRSRPCYKCNGILIHQTEKCNVTSFTYRRTELGLLADPLWKGCPSVPKDGNQRHQKAVNQRSESTHVSTPREKNLSTACTSLKWMHSGKEESGIWVVHQLLTVLDFPPRRIREKNWRSQKTDTLLLPHWRTLYRIEKAIGRTS